MPNWKAQQFVGQMRDVFAIVMCIARVQYSRIWIPCLEIYPKLVIIHILLLYIYCHNVISRWV